MTNIDVWILSRHDGKGMFALAFPTSEALLEYVKEYYYVDVEPGDLPELPADGESLDDWLGALGGAFGYDFAIDHDVMELP